MKKSFIFLLTILLLTTTVLKADEGMWIPLFLSKYNIEDMKKKGFKLSAEDIYDVNKACMKDAVMIFGRGCTAELISGEGLIITNHHCGFGNIQEHSTVEHDYLTNGFWAMNRDQELPNAGLTVTFLVYMEDVTNQVLADIKNNMSEAERQKIIAKAIAKICNDAEIKSNKKYNAVVEPFFYGNEYYLFVSQVFTDIRLVGAPPSSVGKFGGDTDNWMWPRHTGDFSLFRIYADKNNEPAPFSKDNVPFKPKKFFPVSIKGVKEGDFTMVFGYPGHTQQYIPSFEVQQITEFRNPHRILIRQTKLDIIGHDMNSSPEIRIKYAGKQAGIANGWKKWIGENKGLRKLNALDKKRAFEADFTKWLQADEARNKKYKDILPRFETIYNETNEYIKAYSYFTEAFYYLDIIQFASSLLQNLKKANEGDPKLLDETIDRLIIAKKNFFKDYNLATDMKLFAAMLKIYKKNMDKKYLPDVFETIKNKFDNDIDKYVDYIYSTSIIAHENKLDSFLLAYKTTLNYQIEKTAEYKFISKLYNIFGTKSDDAFKAFIDKQYKNLQSDPFYGLLQDFLNTYFGTMQAGLVKYDTEIDSLNRIYLAAQREMQKNKVFYPDANFTLRVSYGNVKSYYPNDGVFYKHFTTLDGIIEKDNPEIYDYNVPEQIKTLYKKKDFGKYADKDGKLHVAFIGNNHTTGGNSGSPVIDAEGNLIGINFDRCWEGTMSDIMYNPDQCRNISLDIRYALFIIDKYAGAKHLIQEMNIIE